MHNTNPTCNTQVQLAIANVIGASKSFVDGYIPVYNNETCCPTIGCYTLASIDNFATSAALFWSGCIAIQAYLIIVVRLPSKAMAVRLSVCGGVNAQIPIFSILLPQFTKCRVAISIVSAPTMLKSTNVKIVHPICKFKLMPK